MDVRAGEHEADDPAQAAFYCNAAGKNVAGVEPIYTVFVGKDAIEGLTVSAIKDALASHFGLSTGDVALRLGDVTLEDDWVGFDFGLQDQTEIDLELSASPRNNMLGQAPPAAAPLGSIAGPIPDNATESSQALLPGYASLPQAVPVEEPMGTRPSVGTAGADANDADPFDVFDDAITPASAPREDPATPGLRQNGSDDGTGAAARPTTDAPSSTARPESFGSSSSPLESMMDKQLQDLHHQVRHVTRQRDEHAQRAAKAQDLHEAAQAQLANARKQINAHGRLRDSAQRAQQKETDRADAHATEADAMRKELADLRAQNARQMADLRVQNARQADASHGMAAQSAQELQSKLESAERRAKGSEEEKEAAERRARSAEEQVAAEQASAEQRSDSMQAEHAAVVAQLHTKVASVRQSMRSLDVKGMKLELTETRATLEVEKSSSAKAAAAATREVAELQGQVKELTLQKLQEERQASKVAAEVERERTESEKRLGSLHAELTEFHAARSAEQTEAEAASLSAQQQLEQLQARVQRTEHASEAAMAEAAVIKARAQAKEHAARKMERQSELGKMQAAQLVTAERRAVEVKQGQIRRLEEQLQGTQAELDAFDALADAAVALGQAFSVGVAAAMTTAEAMIGAGEIPPQEPLSLRVTARIPERLAKLRTSRDDDAGDAKEDTKESGATTEEGETGSNNAKMNRSCEFLLTAKKDLKIVIDSAFDALRLGAESNRLRVFGGPLVEVALRRGQAWLVKCEAQCAKLREEAAAHALMETPEEKIEELQCVIDVLRTTVMRLTGETALLQDELALSRKRHEEVYKQLQVWEMQRNSEGDAHRYLSRHHRYLSQKRQVSPSSLQLQPLSLSLHSPSSSSSSIAIAAADSLLRGVSAPGYCPGREGRGIAYAAGRGGGGGGNGGVHGIGDDGIDTIFMGGDGEGRARGSSGTHLDNTEAQDTVLPLSAEELLAAAAAPSEREEQFLALEWEQERRDILESQQRQYREANNDRVRLLTENLRLRDQLRRV